MKGVRICKIWLMTSIILLLYGCGIGSPKVPDELQASFLDSINVTDMNSSIMMEMDSSTPAKNNSELFLLLSNNSQESIIIPTKTDLFRLFIIIDDEWVEIQNKIQYFGAETVLGPVGNPTSSLRIAVIPILPEELQNQDEEMILRVLFIGEQESNDPNGKIPVGAFVDTYISSQGLR